VIGSDHQAFNYAGQKDLGKDDFTKAPRGFPGIQERISVLHSAGVHSGKITVNRFVDLACTTPAKLFGIFPRKGTLAVGSDADMIIFDPKADVVLSKSNSLSRSDYTPYEGMKVRGETWLVLQHGKVIARERKVLGRPGEGEFLARAKFSIP
jgi:dihydropyrimidinase